MRNRCVQCYEYGTHAATFKRSSKAIRWRNYEKPKWENVISTESHLARWEYHVYSQITYSLGIKTETKIKTKHSPQGNRICLSVRIVACGCAYSVWMRIFNLSVIYVYFIALGIRLWFDYQLFTTNGETFWDFLTDQMFITQTLAT